ncbi:translational GTPase TypA [Desulforamulus ruminis]|uniref:Large ribosomal subunit assembly factor BipA n=1 Tax=Desulforamulus ruminis (strain ATCC 23193 / DSM 2154 / NCIMB 8452 / DL) TaxID=696281 RepID=F6DKZ2_DESRL|nr:translational GTPase TypA [Desulforamulus ruminis]AEG61624.1 GTP-binding protein TypA [Desulforamulus ruminis DSM 2154]
MTSRMDIRNIAIIAHVDHGKTTLVDGMLKQSGIFRANQIVEERVMDSNDLEKERGITILSKNTSIRYEGVKINIVDTPGHSDFGGEVERVLKMVDGVLLLVDASEGPMPQTRFVLRKALELNLVPVVVINKIDRPDSRIDEVVDEILELFFELGASDEQLDFPVVYAIARQGIATLDPAVPGKDLQPLFETIIRHFPAPVGDADAPLQMLVNNTEYDSYIGRIAVGRIARGSISGGETVMVINREGSRKNYRIGRVYAFEGLERVEVPQASCGEIVVVSGIEDIMIGDTITDKDQPEALPSIVVDEPTLEMTFMVNDSPFAGQEGEHVTSRKLRARLYKEAEKNVSMRVQDTDSPDIFKVAGRGELHLSILIETMRREGFELQVSKPEVICRKDDKGQLLEPMELLLVDIPEDKMGSVMETLGNRRGEMVNMGPNGPGQLRLEFIVPARGLIGFRSQLLTETRGHAVMNHTFQGYEPFKGEIKRRYQGVLIAFESGEATQYGLLGAQGRGTLFVTPGTKVYEGMVVGEHARDQDIEVNVCKKKQLTNHRASTAEATVKLEEPRTMSLEECIEYLGDDELLEVTPKSLRIRKRLLDKSERARAKKNSNLA